MVAFSILKYSKYCKSEYKLVPLDPPQQNDDKESTEESKVTLTSEASVSKSSKAIIDSAENPEADTGDKIPFREYIILLVLMAFICGLANGVLPSVSTYSVLPYGPVYYR